MIAVRQSKQNRKKKKNNRLLKVSTSYTYIQQWFTLMQKSMPRRAMQKQVSPRPRVAIGRPTGGSVSRIAIRSTISRNADTKRCSTDPGKRSNVARGNHRKIVLGTVAKERRAPSVDQSCTRHPAWIAADRGVARPSEVSHKSKPAVRCRI